MRITSSEIARICGVSRSTVSRVLNGYSNVPPETKEKVEKVIQEYGYTPNTSARNLAGKPSNVVALVFVEYGDEDENIIHSSPFYSEFLVDAIDYLKRKGYQLLVAIVNKKEDFEAIESKVTDRSVAAFIMMGDIVANDTLNRLSGLGCPICLVNQRSYAPYPNIYLVNTENYKGAYEAVQLLINSGHKRIAHITGAMEKASVKERFEGYRDCLLYNGLEFRDDYLVTGKLHRADSGYAAVQELFRRNTERPTAIFAANDLMAAGAIRALKDMKLKVPGDISVVGFDNASISQYLSPPLTTVATDVQKITQMAVQCVIDVLEKEEEVPALQIMDEFTLLQRGSVAAPGK